MKDDIILRVAGKLVMPFMLLLAGVIAATAIVFYALIFGLAAGKRLVPEGVVEAALALGVLLYAGVGFAGLALGGAYLDYFVLDRDPVHGQHRGIFWVEAGVGITVAGVMLKVFYMFAGRGRDAGDDKRGEA
jgi:multicomponent Na+:H+ antiporter subunit B